jgi:hypothetical protein
VSIELPAGVAEQDAGECERLRAGLRRALVLAPAVTGEGLVDLVLHTEHDELIPRVVRAVALVAL